MSSHVLVSCSLLEKASPYVEALRVAGFSSEEILVAPASDTSADEATHLVSRADGVILCGGPDLDPQIYGETSHPNANLSIMPERDRNELALLPAVRDRRIPVFGICRGLQMINAFLGGTLFQDLRLMWPGSLLHDLSYPRDALIHRVRVTDRESLLGQILDEQSGLVNSRHHQAVKVLATGLRPVALAPDGLVEAFCSEDPTWWVWAVQWHPENLIELGSQRGIWRRFHAVVTARRSQEPVAI